MSYCFAFSAGLLQGPGAAMGAEKAMGKDARRAQKAALKRKKREQKVQESKAQRRTLEQGAGERALLARVKDYPVQECVVSKGWQDRGLAHVLLARRALDGRLVVAGYYLDTLCCGLKDTAVIPNLTWEDYQERVKPHVFNDEVEFEPCAPGKARALVEGAMTFSAALGFRANRRWDESRRVLEGIEPEPAGLRFGRDGKPCLVVRGGENVAAARARLDRAVGPGNYLVEEAREPS
ncbi:MAG: hypothetical protein IH608_12655 [Proteobacteria bacterium]|nr:hypothetical protein [Pseudomonadota bacterium]